MSKTAPTNEEIKELLYWCRTLIKFCVKPEKCVFRGDDMKSAIKIYEEATVMIDRIDGFK